MIVVGWMFARNWRRVCRIEWLTLLPNCGVLPQISHLAIEDCLLKLRQKLPGAPWRGTHNHL
jgi:hypothetical protein